MLNVNLYKIKNVIWIKYPITCYWTSTSFIKFQNTNNLWDKEANMSRPLSHEIVNVCVKFFPRKIYGNPEIMHIFNDIISFALKSILDSGKTISLLCTTLFGKCSLAFLWASFYDFCLSLEKPNEIEILSESWNVILIWRYNPSGKKQLV